MWEVEGDREETNVTACGPRVVAHVPFVFRNTGNVTLSKYSDELNE